MPLTESLLRNSRPPVAIGHRGDSKLAPENTMPAFKAAFSGGALWIETDVQPTADNAMVLIHDDDVDRTTDGTGDIRSLSADAALSLDAGSWFDKKFGTDNKFAGERIPLLTDLLALVTGDRRILLEIKGDHTSEQLSIMLELIHCAGCDERVFLQSFEVPVLERLRALRPQDPIGLLVESIHDDPVAECHRLGATVYNPHFAEVLRTPGLVAKLHSAGIATTPWTSDSPDDWAALTDLGVDGIITNHPGELVSWQAARADG